MSVKECVLFPGHHLTAKPPESYSEGILCPRLLVHVHPLGGEELMPPG